jgi:acyl carrier protein
MSAEKSIKVKQTIIDFICKELSVDAEDIDSEMNLGAYGLGSMAATKLIGIIEDAYDMQLSPLLVFDYPTINALSNAIGDSESA